LLGSFVGLLLGHRSPASRDMRGCGKPCSIGICANSRKGIVGKKEQGMEGPIAVVLAAGMGTRMKSDLPKVLVPVLGRPMIEFVLDALTEAHIERTIAVIGYRADDVRKQLAGRKGLEVVLQTERVGTGHAVRMAPP